MQASTFLKKLKKISAQELIEIKGIGYTLAQNLDSFLCSPRYEKLVSDFEKLEMNNKGLNIKLTQAAKTGLALSDEKICITGSFDISRDQIKEKLENLGAKIVSQVSIQTTILVSGEAAGSKLQKAEKLGIKIVTNLADLGI
jgi:DNA ligase (NAD+)